MLRDSGVNFAAVDLPEANDLTVGIMALVGGAPLPGGHARNANRRAGWSPTSAPATQLACGRSPASSMPVVC